MRHSNHFTSFYFDDSCQLLTVKFTCTEDNSCTVDCRVRIVFVGTLINCKKGSGAKTEFLGFKGEKNVSQFLYFHQAFAKNLEET